MALKYKYGVLILATLVVIILLVDTIIWSNEERQFDVGVSSLVALISPCNIWNTCYPSRERNLTEMSASDKQKDIYILDFWAAFDWLNCKGKTLALPLGILVSIQTHGNCLSPVSVFV